jgi:hypothetical protein
MKEAVLSVINGEMGCKKAANKFAVPQTTLERYEKKERENPGCSVSKEMGRFKCVFRQRSRKRAGGIFSENGAAAVWMNCLRITILSILARFAK